MLFRAVIVSGTSWLLSQTHCIPWFLACPWHMLFTFTLSLRKIMRSQYKLQKVCSIKCFIRRLVIIMAFFFLCCHYFSFVFFWLVYFVLVPINMFVSVKFILSWVLLHLYEVLVILRYLEYIRMHGPLFLTLLKVNNVTMYSWIWGFTQWWELRYCGCPWAGKMSVLSDQSNCESCFVCCNTLWWSH